MLCLIAAPLAPAWAQAASLPPTDASEIVVTASKADMLGKATTASQGTISREELQLRPIYRASQFFESIPGLVVTIHSGEGKAQQYLIRGYNLDHGTDFASFVDDMPANRPTNAHGQGYSDLNFLMPQIVSGIDYTKGPYYANIGDFGAVASAHTKLVDQLPTQAALTIGTDGYQDLFGVGTANLGGDGRLLTAVELGHYDGPWQPGQDFRKANGVVRYSHGSATDGFALTAMACERRRPHHRPARARRRGRVDRPLRHARSQRSRQVASRLMVIPNGMSMSATSSRGAGARRSRSTTWSDRATTPRTIIIRRVCRASRRAATATSRKIRSSHVLRASRLPRRSEVVGRSFAVSGEAGVPEAATGSGRTASESRAARCRFASSLRPEGRGRARRRRA